MELTEECEIALTREEVWAALTDPEALRQCITGCETVERISDTEYTLLIAAKIGPVKARFKGTIELTDLNPPESYTMQGRGTGGVVGFARGSTKIRLQNRTESGKSGTVLSCTLEASVGGKLAQIGSRLVDVAARKLTADFLTRFVALVEE